MNRVTQELFSPPKKSAKWRRGSCVKSWNLRTSRKSSKGKESYRNSVNIGELGNFGAFWSCKAWPSFHLKTLRKNKNEQHKSFQISRFFFRNVLRKIRSCCPGCFFFFSWVELERWTSIRRGKLTDFVISSFLVSPKLGQWVVGDGPMIVESQTHLTIPEFGIELKI